MELLQSFLSEQAIQRIGWVLIHFLWQGVAMMALMWCVLKASSKASANLRYIAACAGLALMVAAPIVTFTMTGDDTAVAVAGPVAHPPVSVTTDSAPVEAQTLPLSFAEPVEVPKPSLAETFTAQLEAALPYCVIGWFFGVAALSLWYLGGWCQLQKLRRIGTRAVPDDVEANALLLWQRLGIRRAVHTVESALVQVPTVIGWLKPVILLPATALTGLDEVQLIAMIAHELAHIKRCDYLVNIVQTVVEILGFYHPAVWWMSRQIRLERENCCDDMAVVILQDRKEYAKALFSMESIRSKQFDLAVAANGGHLSSRISRLTGKPARHQRFGWVPSIMTVITIMVLLSGIFAFNSVSAENEVLSENLIETARLESMGNLKQLGLACHIYYEDQGKPAGTLEDLGPYLDNMAYIWVPENAVLLNADVKVDRPFEVPLAYDKTFLKQYGRRIVLFADGHVEIDNNDGLKARLDKAIQKAAGMSQILTKAYIVDVPADMPELKEILSEDERKQAVITPEQFDAFLNSVKGNPKARVLSTPQLLSNDSQSAHISVGSEESGGQIELKVQNNIASDSETITMQIEFEYTENSDGFRSMQSAATTATVDSGHAMAIGCGKSADNMILLLVKPEITNTPSAKSNVPQTPPMMPESTNMSRSMSSRISSGGMGGGYSAGYGGGGGGTGSGMSGGMGGGMGGAMYEGEMSEAGSEKSPSILDEVIDFSPITADMAVGDAVDLIRTSTDPSLTIIVLWGDLSNNAFIEKDSPIEVDGLGDMKLSAGLRAILRSLSASGASVVDYVVEDGVITIGTKESLSSMSVNGADKDQIQFPKDWEKVKSQRDRRSGSMMMGGVREIGSSILDKVIDFSPITADMAVEEAIDLIRTSSDPPLTIIVLWGDLAENAFIEKASPIDIDGLGVMKLKTGLRAIMRSLSSSEISSIDYVVEDDVITIATQKSLPGQMRTEIYDVRDLVAPLGSFKGDSKEQVNDQMRELTLSISRSVDVGNWVGDGGDGRIGVYNETKLIVHQTPHVHGEIKEYLSKLREESSKQIAIEARFILVDDKFLEDIGIDAPSSVGTVLEGPANSEEIIAALEHKPLAERALQELATGNQQFRMLDDSQTDFIIRATQAHRYAKILSAPKALVLNGEAACMQVTTDKLYKSDADGGVSDVSTGITLDIQPTMQNDDKDVLLKGHFQFSEVMEWQEHGEGENAYLAPIMQVVNIPIHTIVEDSGTVLIDGPELTFSVETEASSNIPVVGGMFKNRVIVSDTKRLLVLIKPTIIIPQEAPEEAIGALAPRSRGMGGFGSGGGGGMMGSYGGGSSSGGSYGGSSGGGGSSSGGSYGGSSGGGGSSSGGSGGGGMMGSR